MEKKNVRFCVNFLTSQEVKHTTAPAHGLTVALLQTPKHSSELFAFLSTIITSTKKQH